MDPEETLARKRENLEKLICNADEAIRREMLKYEEAEYYIRLQSECFNLYPVVVKGLSLLIADDKSRDIFCSIVKGHKLERLAAYHNLTPQEAAQEFRSIVRELCRRIKEGAFTAKESVNIRLLHERDELKCKVQNNDALCKKLQQTNENLLEQFAVLFNEKEKCIENEVIDRLEKELAAREGIIKELREQVENLVVPTATEEESAKSPVSIITRWIQWLRMVYLRL